MKKIAIYARVSTDNGTQDYQRQINDLTKLIISHGYSKEQIEVFAERISGYKKNIERPELNRMLSIIEVDATYFEMIYVTEISRLGRNPSETRRTIDLLTDLKVPVYVASIKMATLNKEGKRDFVMNIVVQIVMELADAESEQMKARSRSGLLTSAKAGKAGGSKHFPYGYTKDSEKMLIVDEDEATIVREIFQLYLEGNGVKIISGILNERKILTRYNKAYAGQTINFNITKNADKITWSDKTVLDIITNPLYKSQRRFKGEIIYAPRIVSDEVFDECEKIRLTKTHRNNLTTYTYLFKNIIKCGCCGRNYFGRYKPTPEGDKVYQCSSSLKTGGRCENKGINIMLLETAIFNELCTSEAVLKYISETKDIRKQLEKDVSRLENQLNAEETSLPTKLAEKKRLLDLLIKDVIDEKSFKEKDDELAKQLANAEKKIKLIKKELSEKKILLGKQTEAGATKRILLEAANNRIELKAIFSQIIDKVIINNLSSKLSLATVYFQLNGVVLKVPLKVVIDKNCIRKKILKYTTLRTLVHEPVFKNDVLLANIEDILNELNYTLQESDWITVNNLLSVEMDEEMLQLEVA
jgi:site-specific DNA recombinase